MPARPRAVLPSSAPTPSPMPSSELCADADERQLDHYWFLIRSMVMVISSRACLMTCRLAS